MKIPPKLKQGDEIRVIAPSDSASIISDQRIVYAENRLRELGFVVTYGKNIFVENTLTPKSIAAKVRDLHDAFKDKKVKAVLSMIGGLSSNELLNHIDWDIIKNNPKVFCGYSDIDTLSLAIYAKTGLITYSGPHFSTFSQIEHFDYTQDYFLKCLKDTEEYNVSPSVLWSDDEWYIDQQNRKLEKNEGWWSISNGVAKGKTLGSNITSFVILKGTPYAPSLKNTILFLEKDGSSAKATLQDFSRFFRSILDIPGADQLQGIVIGRFQRKSEITKEDLVAMVQSKKKHWGIPILANVNFGHTDPKITLPVGGSALLSVTKNKYELRFLNH